MDAPPPPYSVNNHPRVLIAGAGLGGLFMAILLDRAGISYEIFERSAYIKRTGAIMGLNGGILPVFEQLDLYEELKAISLPNRSAEILDSKMERIGYIDAKIAYEQTGYDYLLFTRPRLYDLLLSKVPAEKIHFNKRVVWAEHMSNGVSIQCEDGTTYSGDMLVGADGAYSAVRDALFKTLHCDHLLPAKDKKEMKRGYVCLVGTTSPLDPEKNPLIKEGCSDYYQIIGEGTPYSWSIFNIAENRVCFAVVQQLESEAQCEEEKFNGIPWEPERAVEMMQEIKDFKIPQGGTLGDLFNQTPQESISRIFLENKLFQTWYHDRIVLIGDAAHKLLPSAGQGAVCALQDAVVLVNCLHDMESWTLPEIRAALNDYKEQRYHEVKIQFENSQKSAVLLHGQTFREKLVRNWVFNWLPQSLRTKALVRSASYRPQVSFLPLAPKRGVGEVQPQVPSKRRNGLSDTRTVTVAAF
ncbi:hypothetical protein EMPS_07037 [Entomortierella parvispora]|uniref:FAD-binding domain-containing protein n=1 Tax=Entomortierella parvispora TaxID=205924 RepID=A0A9P3LXZ0_9FUNG|nr:hypothetical protein EMPS_07037 [Entomortierella parvispora]